MENGWTDTDAIPDKVREIFSNCGIWIGRPIRRNGRTLVTVGRREAFMPDPKTSKKWNFEDFLANMEPLEIVNARFAANDGKMMVLDDGESLTKAMKGIEEKDLFYTVAEFMESPPIIVDVSVSSKDVEKTGKSRPYLIARKITDALNARWKPIRNGKNAFVASSRPLFGFPASDKNFISLSGRLKEMEYKERRYSIAYEYGRINVYLASDEDIVDLDFDGNTVNLANIETIHIPRVRNFLEEEFLSNLIEDITRKPERKNRPKTGRERDVSQRPDF